MALDNFRRITIDVDTANDYIAPIMLSSGDSNGRTLLVKLTDNGRSLTSADGIVARLAYDDKSGNSGFKTMDFVDGLETAAWECTPPSSILNGSYALLCIQFWQGADVVCTRVFRANVDRSLICLDPGTESGDAVKELYDAIANLNKTITDANNTLSAAVSSANTEVNAAIGRADASTEKATSAASAASENAGKAGSASDAATKAAERANDVADRAAAAEGKRASVETSRASAEAARADAETARVAAEKRRETDQARNNADQAANNAAAQGLLVKLVAEGGYDPSTLEPTADGKVGTLYLVPDPKASGDNAYAEWMWVNGKWERVGSSNATVAGLTTEQVDAVASGGTVTSENVVNGSVLTYLWAKLRAAFAAIGHKHSVADVTGLQTALDGKAASSHTHNASDVTSGALSIAHGGTGAATAAAARTSLGAASAADLAKVRDSVSRTVTVDDRLAGSSVWCDTRLSQRVCLTARTADRARGHALVASDTSIFLYDLDAQKPIWAMRAQQSPIYFSSVDSFSLTVTAPHDCVIEVEAWFECQWGYGGGEASLSISTPAGLDSMCAVAGRVRGGDTVGRSLHAFGAFSGAKGGATYTFACSLNGSGTGGSKNMIARCFPT